MLELLTRLNETVSLEAGCPLGQIFSVTGNTLDEYALVSAVTTSTEGVHPVPDVHLENTNLNAEEQVQLKSLLTEFAKILAPILMTMGKLT